MKRILTTAIGGVALLAGPALAADLPSRKEPPVAPVVYAPVFTWTGFYVGANAGGAWVSRSNNNGWFPYGFVNGIAPGGIGASLAPFVNYANVNTFYNNSNGNNGGFTGGIQAGYNYQIGSFVVGLEADINYLGTNKNNQAIAGTTYYGDPYGSYRFQNNYYAPAVPVAAPGVIGGLGDPYSGYYRVLGGTNKNNNHYFGTVRARVGFAADRALFFLTGGLAYGGNNGGSGGAVVSYWDQPQVVTSPIVAAPGPQTPPPGAATVAFNGPVGNPTAQWGGYTGGNSNNRVGWTVGGGVEYAFTNNWTVKLEYLYANLGKNNNNNNYLYPTTSLPGFTTAARYFYTVGKNSNANVNVLRVGVNYKF